jgi:hypothetical protein
MILAEDDGGVAVDEQLDIVFTATGDARPLP